MNQPNNITKPDDKPTAEEIERVAYEMSYHVVGVTSEQLKPLALWHLTHLSTLTKEREALVKHTEEVCPSCNYMRSFDALCKCGMAASSNQAVRNQAEIYRQETHRWKEALLKVEKERDEALASHTNCIKQLDWEELKRERDTLSKAAIFEAEKAIEFRTQLELEQSKVARCVEVIQSASELLDTGSRKSPGYFAEFPFQVSEKSEDDYNEACRIRSKVLEESKELLSSLPTTPNQVKELEKVKMDSDFITKVEASHFRTNEDTGANLNALFIWNLVRTHAGLPKLSLDDLPAHCSTHDEYHVIKPDSDCKRTKPNQPLNHEQNKGG